MSTLGDSLWQQYGGDVPADPRSVAHDAIQRYGSGRAAARALGVDEKTIRRWKTGQTHHSDNVDRLAREARRANVDTHGASAEVRMRLAGRDRRLNFGTGAGGKRGLKAGAGDRIANAYVRGDKEGMAKALVGGVQDPFYAKALKRAYDAEGTGAESPEDSTQPGVFLR